MAAGARGNKRTDSFLVHTIDRGLNINTINTSYRLQHQFEQAGMLLNAWMRSNHATFDLKRVYAMYMQKRREVLQHDAVGDCRGWWDTCCAGYRFCWVSLHALLSLLHTPHPFLLTTKGDQS